MSTDKLIIAGQLPMFLWEGSMVRVSAIRDEREIVRTLCVAVRRFDYGTGDLRYARNFPGARPEGIRHV